MFNFNDNLKRIRKEQGLTQKELAKKAGVSLKTIVNLEKGLLTDGVSLRVMEDIAWRGLGCSVSEVFLGEMVKVVEVIREVEVIRGVDGIGLCKRCGERVDIERYWDEEKEEWKGDATCLNTKKN